MPIQPDSKAIQYSVHCPSLLMSPYLHAHCQSTPSLWAAIRLENSRRSPSFLFIFPLHLGMPPCAEWHLHWRVCKVQKAEETSRGNKLWKHVVLKISWETSVEQSKLFQILHSSNLGFIFSLQIINPYEILCVYTNHDFKGLSRMKRI